MFDKAEIINKHRMSFDPGHTENGSLYICDDLTSEPGINVSFIIQRLIDAGLWSQDPVKEVPEEHRSAYEEQLELVEVVAFRDADTQFLAARFDHEKFPSSDARWQAWLSTLDRQFKRA